MEYTITNLSASLITSFTFPLQAKDNDSMVVKYSVTGPDAAQFTVDEITGEVYVVKGLECDPQCNLSVKASDGDNDAQLNVKVRGLILAINIIFSFSLAK